MKTKMMIAATVALLASTAPASAAVFNYTFSGTTTGGQAISGFGTFTTTNTTTNVGGRQAYTVTGITGQRNGIAISGLAPTFPTTFGGADNYLFTSGTNFSNLGVSYALANGSYANFFNDGGNGEYFATNLSGMAGRTNATGLTFTLTQGGAVPEPATWAMMIGGFGMIGGAMRARRRANVNVSFA